MYKFSDGELYFIHDAVLHKKHRLEMELDKVRESDDIDVTLEIELTYLIGLANKIQSAINDMLQGR